MLETMTQCEYPGCQRKAKFSIFKMASKRWQNPEWLNVCASHDGRIGLQNLISQDVSRKEAEEINREMHRSIHS